MEGKRSGDRAVRRAPPLRRRPNSLVFHRKRILGRRRFCRYAGVREQSIIRRSRSRRDGPVCKQGVNYPSARGQSPGGGVTGFGDR